MNKIETSEFYIESMKEARKKSFDELDKWSLIVQDFEKEFKNLHMTFGVKADIKPVTEEESSAHWYKETLNQLWILWDESEKDKRWRIMIEYRNQAGPARQPFMQMKFTQKLIIIPFMDKFLKEFTQYVGNCSLT